MASLYRSQCPAHMQYPPVSHLCLLYVALPGVKNLDSCQTAFSPTSEAALLPMRIHLLWKPGGGTSSLICVRLRLEIAIPLDFLTSIPGFVYNS